MFSRSSILKNIDSIIAAAAGFIIIFLFTRHGGIGISPDGVVYKTAAENILSKGKLVDFINTPVVVFPAFYPLFLSSIQFLTGLKILSFAPYANALLFAIVIILSGYIIEQFSNASRLYKIALLSCIVLSPALLEVYSLLLSETVFILLLLLFMIALNSYFKNYSRKSLLTAAIIASLAAITRYAGITIFIAGGICLVLNMKLPKRQKIKDILLFTFICPSLLIINLIRNNIVSNTNTGIREKSLVSLHNNMHDAGAVFNDWLPFINGHYKGASWTVVIILAWLLLLCIQYFRRNHQLDSYEILAAVFSIIYISFMLVIASITRFETLSSRFFSPVFIFLLWSCSSWIIHRDKKKSSKRKWIIISGILLFIGFQYGQLEADYETWDGVKDAGIPGYTEDQWKYSPTVTFIEQNPFLFRKGFTVYANAYDAVYFFTGKKGKFLPHKESGTDIQQFLNDPHCYVIWFDDGEDPDLIGKSFLLQEKKMKLLKQFDDGSVYAFGE